jgi:methylmalonyl-CoA mutase N-terminal domain/subunit
MQARIADSAYRAQQRIESGEDTLVGVNRFADAVPDAAGSALHRVDPAIERDQCDRLAAFRARRDAAAVARHLSGIERAAAGDARLMPLFVDAVDAGCTLGEICDAMRKVFSVYKPAAAV